MVIFFPTPADDSEFTFFDVVVDDSIIKVSIACELVDQLAGEKLGEQKRLQFLRDNSDFFSGIALRKASAVGPFRLVELDETDFAESSRGATETSALIFTKNRQEVLPERSPPGDPDAFDPDGRKRDW